MSEPQQSDEGVPSASAHAELMAALYPVPDARTDQQDTSGTQLPEAEPKSEAPPRPETALAEASAPASEVSPVAKPATGGWDDDSVVVVRATPIPEPAPEEPRKKSLFQRRPRFAPDTAVAAAAEPQAGAEPATEPDRIPAPAVLAQQGTSVRVIAAGDKEDRPPGIAEIKARAAHAPSSAHDPGAVPPRVIDLTATAQIPTVSPAGLSAESARPGRALVGMEARSVSAWFGDHKVLDGVSLTIAPGEVTALIGPSGCGKSTFLRILNRMHEMVRGAALAGEVLLDGEDIYEAGRRPADVRRRIGMVFQRPNPFPAMSIYDNVVSGLKLAGIHCDDKDALVEQSLRRAGLWNEVQNRLQSPGGALSGGQQQRLCIARSLAVTPDVLLMDEPCSALDPTSTRRIEDTIGELRGQVTIVIVTHNMQQASRVSHACAFFLATHDTPGHIVEAAPTEKLFSDPVDARTADYVHGRFG